MRDKLRRVQDVPASAYLLFPGLLLVSLAAAAAIRVAPIPRVADYLGRLRFFSLCFGRLRLEHLVLLTDAAAFLTYGRGRCLGRALLLYGILKSRGEPAELVIGVRKDASRLHWHAWMEACGRVIGDPFEGPGRYETLLRL
jgi:hypothetical protein